MAGTKESCEELDVNREQAEKSSQMAVVSQVPRIAKVTMDMNAKLASLDGQRQQLKDILRGYGKRKWQIKDNTKALFKKAKKLKDGELEIIADIKGIAVPWDDDDEQNKPEEASSSAASTVPAP
jgi:N-methylhydantoinase B/oxoprolinase/acetone carboxylase alpha subunit